MHVLIQDSKQNNIEQNKIDKYNMERDGRINRVQSGLMNRMKKKKRSEEQNRNENRNGTYKLEKGGKLEETLEKRLDTIL